VHINTVTLTLEFYGPSTIQTKAPDAWLEGAEASSEKKPCSWELTSPDHAYDQTWKGTITINEDVPPNVGKKIYFGDADYFFGEDDGIPKTHYMMIEGRVDEDGKFTYTMETAPPQLKGGDYQNNNDNGQGGGV